jgi:replicative DNA helicase
MTELVTIFAQEASGVSWREVRDNHAMPNQVAKFKKGLERVKGLGSRIIINDRDKTVDQLIARIAASSRAEEPLRAVAVDYLQRYDPQQQKGETRDIAIGRFTMALKDSAIQHNVPVFLGAQIGRGSERESRAPRLSDLRESGNIEQDSDRVWFLWIPDKTPSGAHQDPNDQGLPVLYVQLLQAKGRGDGLGKIDLAFHRKVTTFTDWKDCFISNS